MASGKHAEAARKISPDDPAVANFLSAYQAGNHGTASRFLKELFAVSPCRQPSPPPPAGGSASGGPSPAPAGGGGFHGLFRCFEAEPASFPEGGPAKKKLYSKPACCYFKGMDKITAIIVTAVLATGIAAGIGFCVWLVKSFLTKTAEHIKELLDRDRTSLSEKIGHIEKNLGEKVGNIEELLDRDRTRINEKIGHIEKNLGEKVGNIEELLDRDRTRINEKIGHIDKQFETIDKQLSNHITETNKKIDKLAEGQAKLEAKISDGQAELYKLLSSKSPDKKK